MASKTWRTLNLGKLRSVLPSSWSSRQKSRMVREIREKANIATALHNVGSDLVRLSMELALDQFLALHGFIDPAPNGPHLQNMPAIQLQFSVRPFHLVPVAPLNHQDAVFASITPQGAAQVKLLSDSYAHYCVDAVNCVSGIARGAQPGYLRNVYEHLIQPNLLADPSRLKEYIDLARHPRRNETYYSLASEHLGTQMLGNMKTMTITGFEKAISRVLQDLVADLPPQLHANLLKALVERTLAFLSPRHVRLADVNDPQTQQPILPLNVNHPLFQHLPHGPLGQQSRQTWIRLVRPIHTLLRYALAPQIARVLLIPVHALANQHQTQQDIREDAGLFWQWRHMLHNPVICERVLPLMRYLSRLHRHYSIGQNGLPPAHFKSINVFPRKTEFRTEMISFNAHVLQALITRSLTRPWENMEVFAPPALAVAPIPLAPPAPLLARSSDYAKRQIFNVLFPGMFRNQLGGAGIQQERKQTPLLSAHSVRLRGQDNPIEKCFIRTDGTSISFHYLLDSTCPKWVTQPRIAAREEMPFEGLHKNTPLPDTHYPGTHATGSLSSLSRQPLLPQPHFLQAARPVIGIDPGQAFHVVATIQEPAEAYEALVAGGDAQAKQAFASRQRKVRGRHSHERTLAARSERVDARRRKGDASRVQAQLAAGGAANELIPVDAHMDNLKQANIIAGGADVEESAGYLQQKRASFSRLHQFWNKNQTAPKQRFLNRANQTSYNTRLVRFVSWKITRQEFLKEGRPIVVKHSRRTSRKCWRRKRDGRHFQRPDQPMQPIVAFGWGQGSGWSRGYAAATQFTVAHQIAMQGSTVLMTPERGTSTVCTARMAPMLAIGAIQPHHNVDSLLIRYRADCQQDDHTMTKFRVAGHRHALQRFCRMDDRHAPEVTSEHTQLGNWQDLHRLQICSNLACNSEDAHNTVYFDERLRQHAPHLVQNDNRRILNRDSNSAAAMRAIIRHYILRQGDKPAWNGGVGFHGAIPPATWAGYTAPAPANPATFVR